MSQRTIQDNINKIDSYLLSLRTTLEKLQTTTTDNIHSIQQVNRSVGQLKRSIRNKMDILQMLYDDIKKKKATYSDRDFSTSQKVELYQGYLPNILIIIQEILDS